MYIPKGYKFVCWIDKENQVVSLSENGSLGSFAGFHIYTPIFVPEDTEIAEKIYVSTLTPNAKGYIEELNKHYIIFNAMFLVPQNYEILEYGVLYGTSASTFGTGNVDEKLKFEGDGYSELKTKVYKSTGSLTTKLVSGVYEYWSGNFELSTSVVIIV